MEEKIDSCRSIEFLSPCSSSSTVGQDGDGGGGSSSSSSSSSRSRGTVIRLLEDMFMPIRWRETCKPDYLAYQTYDSLQAIFCSISGMIASRETLVSIGFGRADSSLDSALLINIASEAVSRMASILWSWRYSDRVDSGCKKYRFLADIFNDCSIVLGTMSSLFPSPYLRTGIVLAAAASRTLCGVCAGSSKAALTNHFAIEESSVSDISAKDGSQETVISLIGLLLGYLLVPFIVDSTTVWTCLAILVYLHLLTNYRAVKSVHMSSLNPQRLCILLEHHHHHHHQNSLLRPSDVASRESILFQTGSALRLHWITDMSRVEADRELIRYHGNIGILRRPNQPTTIGIILRQGATHRDIIKGLADHLHQHSGMGDGVPHLTLDMLKDAGWNVSRDSLRYNGLRYALITSDKKTS